MPQIRLSWSPNPASQLVHAYEVWEQLNDGAFNLRATVSAPEHVYTPNAGLLRWKVRAVNLVGVSGFSPIAEGPTLPTSPGEITVEVV